MTTLAITPNWKNKSAKFKGTVAAGEHVSVTIQNDDGEGGEFIADASTLRLRVVNPCNGRTLAIFPEPVPEGETPETWDSDLSPLRCTLNLNTVQMLKAVPPAANVPLLWVLDDYDNNTLYFKEQFPVEHWPRLRGEEEPTDLDNYKDIIADFNTRLDGYDTRITGAENAAQAATANASAANGTANEAKAIANDAVGVAQQAKEAAETSQESAAASATAAQNAAEAAIAAAESINSPDATLTEEGVAADAKATGEVIAAEETRAKAAEAAEKSRAEGVESGLDTRLTAAEKAIDDEAILRAAADADLNANKADKTAVAAISSDVAAAQTAISNLSANKADKATTYTKTEVDTKIAGVQTFQKYLVQTLPDPDEANMKGLYLVPTGETSEEGDLCEEWTVVEEDGEKRWEKIGGTTVDISSKQDKLYVVYPGDWTVSAYQHNEQIDAFVDAAVDVDVTITQQGPAQFLYVLTGYDEESYYVTPVVSTARTDNILFGVYDSSATTLYGYVRATLVESRQDVPAEVLSQVVPTGDSLVKSSGIWSAIWGALSALPTGFSSLYDWCVAQLAGKVPTSRTVNGKALSSDVTLTGADIAVSGTDPTKIDAALAGKATKSDVDPLLFAQYYPDGSVKSAAEFTSGIKYDAPDTTNCTITVKPFCYTGDTDNDNSGLVGRVVLPPFVDASGNPYISDDGTRYKVVGVSGGISNDENANLTAVVAPNTVTSIEARAFVDCTSLASVSLPAAMTIGIFAFANCTSLASVSLPAATGIEQYAFDSCTALTSVDFGDTPRPSVPSLGYHAFYAVPPSCKIIVPYMQYDEWKAASGWRDLQQEFVRHAEKADKPTTFTTGNLAKFDANGNPTDAQIPAANVAVKGNIPYDLGTPIVINTASSETVEGETVNYGAATLADRTANIVQVTAATALDELRITFPAATSGKVRDFGLRVEIGTGSAALAAPALVPVAPTGETVTLENADGEMPTLADGTATTKGVTLLYFSENAPGVFVVKGEQVEEVA